MEDPQISAAVAQLLDYAKVLFFGLTTIVTGASAIAAITPTKKDDAFLGRLIQILDAVALNIGKRNPRKDDSDA